MTRQLNIRSDEAYGLAHDIAQQTGRPVTEVVLKALRDMGSKLPPVEGLNPTQRAEYEAWRAMSREFSKHKKPGATSDHRDMYDEFGLPK